MPGIAIIGEVMLELSPETSLNNTSKNLSFAGDTYNTAITLARLGLETSYITRLGKDHYSQSILAKLKEENINIAGTGFSEDRIPGLYMIHNSANGEREFAYWRSHSAAKELFSSNSNLDSVKQHLQLSPWIYFSGITLAILSVEGRENFFEFLTDYRANGGKIAFDSNYRPALWTSRDTAQAASRAALQLCNIALLTLDDEEILWGDNSCENPRKPGQRYKDFGIDELVFKRGADDVIVIHSDKEERFPVKKVSHPIDTTAAGDNFNAGYLAARLQHKTIRESVQHACNCAAVIIQHRGGVIDSALFMEELGKL